MANRGPVNRVPACKEFLLTRSRAIHLSPSNFTQFMTQSTVYGAVVDMPMAPNFITTLACFINGAANLYFSNGGDYSGAAQRYPGVVQAARVFVANAARYLEDAEATTSLELPAGRTHFLYLLSTKGIYRMELNATAANRDPKERVLMNLYQRVMAELRTAQMKDKALGGSAQE